MHATGLHGKDYKIYLQPNVGTSDRKVKGGYHVKSMKSERPPNSTSN